MEQSKVITINGLTTRVWTYKPEHGYGCAECCNGDRCDEDCTAKYRRPNCPHCKGRGWVKEIPASDYAALQAKCDKYEKALNAIIGRNMPVPNKVDMIKIVREALGLDERGSIANEALSGEGKEEAVKEIEYMPVHPEDARKPGCPQRIPMHLLNEARAQCNHSQTLQRLKERGGLGVAEILSIVHNKGWSYYGGLKWPEALAMLNDILNQKEDKQ